MIITPFSYNIAHPVAAWLTKKIKSKKITKHNSLFNNKDFLSRGIQKDHVIITGFGFNGQNLANVFKKSNIPYIILDLDLNIVKQYKEKGEPIFYGDASSIDLLNHVGINNAKMLVCTISNPIMQRIIISNARKLNNCLYIIVRTKYVSSVSELKEIGANDVIAGEFEISLEILHRVFIYYNMPLETIENTLETIRKNNYSLLRDSSKDKFAVLGELKCTSEADIRSFKIENNSFMKGKSIKEIDIRKNTGVTILAIRRDNDLISNPNPDIKIKVNDILLFSGDRKSFKKAIDFFNSSN
jgi:CPA2 family monovalent cation:H+ antiporter-2